MSAHENLATVHGTLGQALGLLGDPARAVEAAGLLLEAYEAAGATYAAPQEPATAAEVVAAWERPIPIELPSGWTALGLPLALTAELLAGTLPNRVLVHVLGWESEAQSDAQRRQQAIEELRLLLNIARRSLVSPRLVLPEDEREPDPARNEIGPQHLRPEDLRTIRQRVLYDALPEVAAAPFRTPDDAPGGAGAA
jgi:hypothetical protein